MEQARAGLEEARRLHARYVATPGGASRTDIAQGKLERARQALVMEIALELTRSPVVLEPDSVVGMLDTVQYGSLVACSVLLGRSWKRKLGQISAGGSYDSLGLPPEMCAALERALLRIGHRLQDLRAVPGPSVDPTP